MKAYKTTNKASFHKKAFTVYQASKVKSLREDFADMFTAEAEKRRKAGDLSVVFCLTYNDEHLHLQYGQNMVCGDDLKCFSKASKFAKYIRRKFGYDFDMVSVGEYGCGGETHDCIGKRGKGQNPHFHCGGWFHDAEHRDFNRSAVVLGSCGSDVDDFNVYFDGFLPEGYVLVAVGIYDVLCALLRFQWQGTFHDNVVEYGRSMHARSCGLGFVNMQGPLKSSYSGASYFSKYIGKDISSVWKTSYTKGFAPFFLPIVIDAIIETYKGSKFTYNFPYDAQVTARWILLKFIDLRLYCGLVDFDYFVEFIREHSFVTCDDIPELLPHFTLFSEKICATYTMYHDDFMSDLNTLYSPKVRKFQGFGHSLADDANLEKGTYICDGYERILPPSIRRSLYYDYHVVPLPRPDVVSGRTSCVKYTLNALGRKYLKNRLRAAVDRDIVICQSLGSPELKKYAREVSILRNCLVSFDILASKFHFKKWFAYTKNLEGALNFSVALRPTSVPDLHVYDDRCFVNVLEELKYQKYNFWCMLCELDDLHESMLSVKNYADLEFSQHWLRVYNSNF